MRMAALPAPVRVGSALLVAGAITCAQLALVVWMNRPDHPIDPPARMLPAPVLTPPKPKRPPPQPDRATSLEQPNLRAPTPQPMAALEPTAVAALPDLHSPTDHIAVLPGLSAGDLGRLDTGGLGGEAAVDTPAQPLRRPRPSYPPKARRKRIEGYVDVRLRVDATGKVVDAVVVAAEPPGIFDDSALSAARRYRFEPAVKNGSAAADTVEQRMVFRAPR